ncbi:cytochrome P450 [Saccharopolyspora taberi]
MLLDPDFWSQRSSDPRIGLLDEQDAERRSALKDFFSHWPVFSDGDHHKRMRHAALRLLRGVVTPELTETCRKLATSRLVEAGESPFDWIARIARPLAREAVAALTGRADADRLVELGNVVMDELATPRLEMDRVDAALAAIAELREWLRGARAEPGSAFVAGLAKLWDDERFGPDSATSLLTQIVTGAYEPTVASLAVAGERVTGQVLASVPPQAVREEVFRLATPFRFASRYVRRPAAVGPHQLDTGDRVVLCLGTANLDPDHFPEPLEIRHRKGQARSLSFGVGPHHCPGAPLARAVVEVLLGSMAELGVHFVADRVEREPELPMLRYRRLEGRLVHSEIPAEAPR